MTLPHPSFAETTRTFARIGLLSFGGPAGQIALMHKELVEERRWLSEHRFLHALNFCMLLPGPEAMQLAAYCGWALHGLRGGIVAGVLFILPGFILITALAAFYAQFAALPLLQALFLGLKAAVLAIVVEALFKIGKRALKTPFSLALAIGAFLALFAFAIPFPLVILGAALIGFLANRLNPRALNGARNGVAAHGEDSESLVFTPPAARPFVETLAVWGGLWLAPILISMVIAGPTHILTVLQVFFSKMAMVTFGGAYAVLAYVQQAAVTTFGWLTAPQMIDGLALAETTPGPLILVLVYVGFLAAFQSGMVLPPFLAGLLGAALTAWVTFIPCFLWIFLGAPHLERLRHNQAMSAALAAITAAVVGVIGNLALWFALKTLFGATRICTLGPLQVEVPLLTSANWPAIALALLACLGLFRARLSVPVLLMLCAALSLGAFAFGLVPA